MAAIENKFYLIKRFTAFVILLGFSSICFCETLNIDANETAPQRNESSLTSANIPFPIKINFDDQAYTDWKKNLSWAHKKEIGGYLLTAIGVATIVYALVAPSAEKSFNGIMDSTRTLFYCLGGIEIPLGIYLIVSSHSRIKILELEGKKNGWLASIYIRPVQNSGNSFQGISIGCCVSF
jgi:hypothetical protein